MKNNIVFKIERDVEGGYCANSMKYGIFTEGETYDELIANIDDAVSLYYEVAVEEMKQEIPFTNFPSVILEMPKYV